MGLFGGTSKKEARTQVSDLLMNCQLMQMIIQDFRRVIAEDEEDECYWLYSTRSYYDARMRTVIVHETGISIYNCPSSEIRNIEDTVKKARLSRKFMWMSDSAFEKGVNDDAKKRNAIESIGDIKSVYFDYTWFGYTPVQPYTKSDGSWLLDKMQVLEIMADAFKNNLQKCLPDCDFFDVYDIDLDMMKGFAFSYHVPELKWKNWF